MLLALITTFILAIASAAAAGIRVSGASISVSSTQNGTENNIAPYYSLYLITEAVKGTTTSPDLSFTKQCSDSALLAYLSNCPRSIEVSVTGVIVNQSTSCWESQCAIIKQYIGCAKAALLKESETTNVAYHAAALQLMTDCTARGHDVYDVSIGNLSSGAAAALRHPATVLGFVAAISTALATML